MDKISFLGPAGATFSSLAYDALAQMYACPPVFGEVGSTNYDPAVTNSGVLSKILCHGGYGTLAMETSAGGRVAEPLESFIRLLCIYTTNNCPLRIIGAAKFKIDFCLMARKGVRKEQIFEVLGHQKAFDACRSNVAKLNVPTFTVSSNGEAARLVAETGRYLRSAALAPKSAAEKYGLKILNESFQDTDAITTFFLIGPSSRKVVTGEHNRALILFTSPHEPKALVRALEPFGNEGLNMIQIHSMFMGDGKYGFAIEFDLLAKQIRKFLTALQKFESAVTRSIVFGPFEVRA